MLSSPTPPNRTASCRSQAIDLTHKIHLIGHSHSGWLLTGVFKVTFNFPSFPHYIWKMASSEIAGVGRGLAGIS